MKINATIVKEDGFCYGMVMPEKPYYKNYTDESKFKADTKAYQIALENSKDAAIRYEDQEAAIFNLPKEAFPTQAGMKKLPAIIQGVYPLPEPLEVSEILQHRVKGASSDWITHDTNSIDTQIFDVRSFLRISQGADNQNPPFDMDDMPYGEPGARQYNKKLTDSAHGYTESEPSKKCELCNGEGTHGPEIGDACPVCHGDGFMKVGVVEKKPETLYEVSSRTAGDSKNLGVSEREEPTQANTVELWAEVQDIFITYEYLYKAVPVLVKEFTIQRKKS